MTTEPVPSNPAPSAGPATFDVATFDPVTFDIAAAALTDAELAALLEHLEAEEATASRRRGSLHNRIEFVHAGGGASPEMAEDQLASMQTNERNLSGRRRALHLQIDLLRAERSRRLA